MAKDRRVFGRFSVVVENPAGSVRAWRDAAGNSGETKLLHDYGYIEDQDAPDGDELDCYLGPAPDAAFVHVVHQLRAPDFTGWDEDKCMLGFADEASAKAAYLAHRNDGERAYGGMSSMPVERFLAKMARRGSGKVRHSAFAGDIGEPAAMSAEPRVQVGDAETVTREQAARRVEQLKASGQDATEAEADLARLQRRLRIRGAAGDAPLGPRAGSYSAFQAVGSDGRIRVGVWDRICVPGEDYKDGQSTEFTRETLSEMVDNFARRGDAVPIDYDHQSNHAPRNGRPAPALGFYGAFAVVWDGQIVKTAAARGVEIQADYQGLDKSLPGLWALRSKVTPLGEELLPNYQYLSPTFTPRGTTRDGTQVGYMLAAVAATNVPWQPGTQITFDGRGAVAKLDAVGSFARAFAQPGALARAFANSSRERPDHVVLCPKCRTWVGEFGGRFEEHKSDGRPTDPETGSCIASGDRVPSGTERSGFGRFAREFADGKIACYDRSAPGADRAH